MKLEKIITLANSKVELRFLAMVRSLREVGCNLPVLVIPYDDKPLFELPDGCKIWREEAIFELVNKYPASGVKRKYATLTQSNYHFVDSDVVFLKNPELALNQYSGFITCCGHWRSSDHIATPSLTNFLRSKTSLWHKLIFNSGQYASDQSLFQAEELIELCRSKELLHDTLEFVHHEQPGLNFLVHSSNANYHNLTLPPVELESSWAGDYLNSMPVLDSNKSPYLIHWAGMPRGQFNEVDHLFLKYLSHSEREELQKQESIKESFWKKSISKLTKVYNNIN